MNSVTRRLAIAALQTVLIVPAVASMLHADDNVNVTGNNVSDAVQGGAMPINNGTWVAKAPADAVVQLTFVSDNLFSWTQVSGDQRVSFEGVYSLSNKALTLMSFDGSQRVTGDVVMLTSNSFHFRTENADANAVGLTFAR